MKTYLEMIIYSIKHMKYINNSNKYFSQIAIKKALYLLFNKESNSLTNYYIRRALRKGVATGVLIQNKNSYKLKSK